MKHRILVVDDDPFLTEASSILLGLEGHDCRTANTGPEALAEARQFDPDIVIIDLGLPGMDGYQVAQALRASAGAKPLHLAALTGREEPRDKQHSREAGFDQHVVKPVDAEMLKAIVRTAERSGIAPTQA